MKFNIKSIASQRTVRPGCWISQVFNGRNIRKLVLGSLLVAVATTQSLEADAQVLSLDTILSMIDRRNPLLDAYSNQINAAEAYASGAKAWMPPMVGAGRWMAPYARQSAEQGTAPGSWMLSIEQDIPNPSKLNANKHYLESKTEIAKNARAVQSNTLRAEAKNWYYQWLVAEKKLKVLKEDDELITLLLKLARIRYPYNQGTLGNIYKAEGRLAEVRNAVLATHAEIAEARFRLKALALIPAGDSIMIDTTTSAGFDKRYLSYDTAELVIRRSDVKQMEATIASLRARQQLQKFQTKPDFKIRFDHMQGQAGMPAQFTAMFMVSLPIVPWANKQYKADIRGTEYEIASIRESREALLNQTEGILAGIESQTRRILRQLENYDTKIIPALRKNYESLMLAYEENREQLPVVIEGWEALNAAQLEQLNKLEEYYQMIVRYETELEL